MTTGAVIGLGSNQGNPEKLLLEAVNALERAPHVTPVALSSAYRTEPVGGVPQPRFLNAALLVEAELTAAELMTLLLGVEAALGRRRRVRWGPRRIDLDLLFAFEQVVETPLLTLPHPRLRERPFALIPLLELLPDAVDPTTGERYRDVLGALDRAGVGEPRPLPSSIPRRDLDHTADLGFTVTGASQAAAVENAAQALVDLVSCRERVTERERRVVEVTERDDPVERMVELLSEVVFLVDAREFVPRRAALLELGDERTSLALFGETLRDELQLEAHVKAVTYHGAQLARDSRTGRWQATVILDV